MENLYCYEQKLQSYLDEYHCILNQMINKMTSVELSCSISYNFMVQMIPHHRAAILMSCNLLKYTKNEALQNIAFNIIKEQTRSIENMRRILCDCQNQTNSQEQLYDYQNRLDIIVGTMFTKMAEPSCSNDIDVNFINEMIPHHEGAIAMAKTTLDYPICSELKTILQAIITSQSNGVRQLKTVLEDITC